MSPRAAVVLLLCTSVSGCAGRTRAPLEAASTPLVRSQREAFRDQQPPASPRPAWTPPTPRRSQLANGMPVYWTPSAGSSITVRYCNKRAGEDDGAVSAGLASLTANLLLEGTRTHQGTTFQHAVTASGAWIGAETYREGGSVSLTVSRPEGLSSALALLFEAVREPLFAEREFTVARTSQMDDRAAVVLSTRSLSKALARHLLFGGAHVMGRPTTGLGPEIRARRVEEVREFHRTHYLPSYSAIVVAGGDEATVRAELEQTFGRWAVEGVAPLAPRVDGARGERPSARVHMIDRGAVSQSHVLVAWSGPPRYDQDWPALLALDAILGGMFSSRLNMALRADQGYTYGARSSLELSRRGGILALSSDVETDNTAPALRRLLDEVQRVRVDAPSRDELAAAVRSIESDMMSSFETSSSAAAAIEEVFYYDLPLDYYATLVGALRRLQPDAVRDAAQRFMPASEAIVVVAGDRDAILFSVGHLGLNGLQQWDFQ